MIKCNVTVCGTVSRSAVKRTGKEGKPFSVFGVDVVMTDNAGNSKTIEVSVAKDGDEDLSMLTVGTRVDAIGVLTFHKKDTKLWFNLTATAINSFNASDNDSITGDMEFRGTLGKKTIENKKDKKGDPFRIFSAYSSERISAATETEEAKYSFIWVRFLHFTPKDAEWLAPSCGVDVKGDLDVSVYKDLICLGCKVKEVAKWDKQQNGTKA